MMTPSAAHRAPNWNSFKRSAKRSALSKTPALRFSTRHHFAMALELFTPSGVSNRDKQPFQQNAKNLRTLGRSWLLFVWIKIILKLLNFKGTADQLRGIAFIIFCDLAGALLIIAFLET